MSIHSAHLLDPFWRSGPARREPGKDPIQMIARVSNTAVAGAVAEASFRETLSLS